VQALASTIAASPTVFQLVSRGCFRTSLSVPFFAAFVRFIPPNMTAI
jgi:hypothetical protein